MLKELVQQRQLLQDLIDVGPCLQILANLCEKSQDHPMIVEHLMAARDRVIAAAAAATAELQAIDIKISAIGMKMKLNPDRIDACRIEITDQQIAAVSSRLSRAATWKRPAAVIGSWPVWTQYLVSADIIYVLATDQAVIQETQAMFNPEFSSRIRFSLLQDHDLSSLPVGQFAVMLSWDYLTGVSWNNLVKYLTQVRACLCPGGKFIFNFCDAESVVGAALAESQAQSYQPRSEVAALARDLGFSVEIITAGSNLTWAELTAPGSVESIKLHPTQSTAFAR